MNWEDNLIDSIEQIHALLRRTKRIAVLGMEKEEKADRAAFYVPKYLMDRGFEVIPIPVKYPELASVAGLAAFHRVSDIPGEIDLVDVFRKPADIPAHLDDLLAKRPKAVWFQLGIRNDEAAERLARAGIQVVQDRCLMVDLRLMR